MQRFQGKVALITGASAGIGAATSRRLAEEGASLFLLDVNRDGLEATAKECAELGAEVEHRLCDVSSEEEVRAAVAACVERHGRLDTLINIAGILLLEHFENIGVEQFRRILDVNLVGTFLTCQAALPHLRESGGNIVNTSSTSALEPRL